MSAEFCSIKCRHTQTGKWNFSYTVASPPPRQQQQQKLVLANFWRNFSLTRRPNEIFRVLEMDRLGREKDRRCSRQNVDGTGSQREYVTDKKERMVEDIERQNDITTYLQRMMERKRQRERERKRTMTVWPDLAIFRPLLKVFCNFLGFILFSAKCWTYFERIFWSSFYSCYWTNTKKQLRYLDTLHD